jgi:hypothetical protein
MTKITNKLHDEGYTDIDLRQVRYFVKTRYKLPKLEKYKNEQKVKEQNKDISAELKLHDSIKEAFKNYEGCKDKNGKIIKGKEKEALEWHKEYQSLLEKLIKTEGLYEKAKQDASKEDDKKIEVIWKFVTICDKCQSTIEEHEDIHSVLSEADMQVEDVKETIVKELTEECNHGKDE